MLHLLHPATPFVTEELWSRRYGSPGGPLIAATWPAFATNLIDEKADSDIDWLIRAISAIRAARSEVGVPPATKMTLTVHGATEVTTARLARHQAALERLARLDAIQPTDAAIAKGSVQLVVDEATYALPLADVIDLDQERQRLQKELAKITADLDKIDKKLANPQFIDRAPAEVVEEQRSRRVDIEQNREKLSAALARIAD
jgi:valyl-tRNA synthetase